jgi:hypothetical protein
MRLRNYGIIVLFCGLLLPASGGSSAERAPDFERDVLPIFEEKCIRCHGGKKKGGKLDMRTEEAMIAGGDTGPAFKAGNSGKSLLIELIHYKEMPPKKEEPAVTAEEMELLKQWIDAIPANGSKR